MNPRLVEEGWVAPADPGPTRRLCAVLAGTAFLLYLVWALLPAGNGARLGEEPDPPRVVVAFAEDGSASIDGSSVATELRLRGGTPFLVAQTRISSKEHDEVDVDVRVPPGVDEQRVATRVVPGTGSRDIELLVTVPARAFPQLRRRPSAGALAAVTGPVDERVREAREDRRLHDRLRDGWWWIVPLGLAGSTLLPLLLWWRAAREFFSMRVPGPGTSVAAGPPSSLDPISVAVLVAGARRVDEAAAFAGHVLDLVERRQLRLRRTDDSAHGVGAVLGLAGIEEDVPGHADPAVAALRGLTLDDGITVPLPDDPARRRGPSPEVLHDWRTLLAGRARFERMLDEARWRPTALAAALAAMTAALGVAIVITAGGEGRASAGWLLVAIGVTAAVVLGLWARDASRWRRVTRARRTERAQWIAWTAAVGTEGGPVAEQRNLPLVVAAGRGEGMVPVLVPRDAIGLDAVSARTLAALHGIAATPG